MKTAIAVAAVVATFAAGALAAPPPQPKADPFIKNRADSGHVANWRAPGFEQSKPQPNNIGRPTMPQPDPTIRNGSAPSGIGRSSVLQGPQRDGFIGTRFD